MPVFDNNGKLGPKNKADDSNVAQKSAAGRQCHLFMWKNEPFTVTAY